MTTGAQNAVFDRFQRMGYEPLMMYLPAMEGALLVTMPGKWVDQLELTLNVDGSYHTAWDEEMAA